MVVRLGGRLVSSGELRVLIAVAGADPDADYVDTITVHEDLHLVMPARSVTHFANHGCDPTLWHVGPYALATRRDVDAGEELTIDYGTNSGAAGFVMVCRCGSADCRGRVSSEDWRRPELRVRYDGHWTPALQRRIDRLSHSRTPDAQHLSTRPSGITSAASRLQPEDGGEAPTGVRSTGEAHSVAGRLAAGGSGEGGRVAGDDEVG